MQFAWKNIHFRQTKRAAEWGLGRSPGVTLRRMSPVLGSTSSLVAQTSRPPSGNIHPLSLVFKNITWKLLAQKLASNLTLEISACMYYNGHLVFVFLNLLISRGENSEEEDGMNAV